MRSQGRWWGGFLLLAGMAAEASPAQVVNANTTLICNGRAWLPGAVAYQSTRFSLRVQKQEIILSGVFDGYYHIQSIYGDTAVFGLRDRAGDVSSDYLGNLNRVTGDIILMNGPNIANNGLKSDSSVRLLLEARCQKATAIF